MNAKNENINYCFYLFLLYLYLMCEKFKNVLYNIQILYNLWYY